MESSVDSKAHDDAVLESLLADILQPAGSNTRGLGYITPRHFVREAIEMLRQDDEPLVRLLAEQIVKGESETLIREYNCFLRRIDESDLKRGMRLVLALRMSHLPWSPDYSKADALTQSRCVALMNVVSAVDLITGGKTTSMHYTTPQHSYISGGWLVPVLTDAAMEEFIFEHPEEAPRLIAEMHSSGRTDFRVLRATLEGIAAPLASGHL